MNITGLIIQLTTRNSRGSDAGETQDKDSKKIREERQEFGLSTTIKYRQLLVMCQIVRDTVYLRLPIVCLVCVTLSLAKSKNAPAFYDVALRPSPAEFQQDQWNSRHRIYTYSTFKSCKYSLHILQTHELFHDNFL